MGDLWVAVPVTVQDVLGTALLVLPGLLVGALVLQGLDPWPLVGAMLRRYRAACATFVALIAVAVGLGAGLTAQERAIRAGTARAAAPFDVVVGAPGSEVTLMLASVYLQLADMPLVSGADYDRIARDPDVALAAPIAFGDSVRGVPIVGTIPALVTHLSGSLAEGRTFVDGSEAVAGARAPVTIGERIEPSHGFGPAAAAGAHQGLGYTVVGRMAATGSPWDRAVLVPIEGVWEMHGFSGGHPTDAGDAIGPPFDPADFYGTPAILVRVEDAMGAFAVRSRYSRGGTMAIFPGAVLSGLHAVLSDAREAMSLVTLVTQGLVAASVLAGLSLLVRLLARSLALLRALGAPRRFVLAVVWSLAGTLVSIGALAGLALGGFAALVLSRVVTARTDVLVTARIGWTEAQGVAAFVSVALLLSLVPALLACRRPLLSDLRG